ncbi:MAG: HEAT repeat domain-containing protein [Planctomycetes bacterium]|nr:HEAT repeat domain-containing protein [Planctomycetota bacterium]
MPPRARASRDLEAIRDVRAEAALLGGLRASRVATRIALLGGLASIGTDAAWDRIVRIALEDEEEEMRSAARLRSRSGGDAAPSALNRRLETWYALDARGRARGQPEAEVRLRAVELASGLTGFGGRRALYVLALLDPSSRVRHEAAAGLARVPDERVFRGLVDAVRSGHPMLQPRAASALEAYADPRAIGPLIDALDRLLRDRAGGVLRADSPFTLPAQMSGPAQVPLSLAAGADEQGSAGLSLLPSEVSALQRLSGRTFGEDVGRWRAWLAAQATPDEGDPR